MMMIIIIIMAVIMMIILIIVIFSSTQFYIGLYRHKTDMTFKWIDGKSHNYTNWYSYNETTRPADKNENRLCAYYGLDYKWHLDGGCSSTRRYICQIV